VAADCSVGESCYPVNSCKINDEDDAQYDWYCGETTSMAAKCFKGSECPSKTDAACRDGESCFPISCATVIGEDEAIDEKADQFDWYCGETYQAAAKCVESSECPSKVAADCSVGELCYPVNSCVMKDEDDAQYDWYCGETVNVAAKCFIGSKCPSEADLDCPIGQSCFSVTCDEDENKMIDDTDGKFEWHCGKTYPMAAKCIKGSDCPSKEHRDCPGDDLCFPVISCQSIDEENVQYEWHCGKSSTVASKCVNGSDCPSRTDADCPVGQSCFPVSCEATVDGEAIIYDDYDKGQFEWHCGRTYPMAAECVNDSACPSKSNEECPINETCFPVIACHSEAPKNFCGPSEAAAAQCKIDSVCPGGYGYECPNGEECFYIEECADKNIVSHKTFDWYCGATYIDANKCVVASSCSPTTDDCSDGEYCFPVITCEADYQHFCGLSEVDAAQCRVNSSCTGGTWNECPDGEKCFNVAKCIDREANKVTTAPSLMPSPIPRDIMEYSTLLCVEHSTLEPIFLVRKEINRIFRNGLTDLFEDRLVLDENVWNVTEFQFQVDDVGTTWLTYVPEILDCECTEGDGISSCSAFNTSVQVSYWEHLHYGKVRYLLLAFAQDVIADMKNTTSWGSIPVSTNAEIRLSALPISDMPHESKALFQNVLLREFNRYIQRYQIPNFLILVVDILFDDELLQEGMPYQRSLLTTSETTPYRKRNIQQSLNFRLFIAGEHSPPPEINFAEITNDFIAGDTSRIVNTLATSDDPYFSGMNNDLFLYDDYMPPTIELLEDSTDESEVDPVENQKSEEEADDYEKNSEGESSKDDEDLDSGEPPSGADFPPSSGKPPTGVDDEQPSSRRKPPTGTAVGVGIAAIFVVAGIIVLLVICIRKKQILHSNSKERVDNVESPNGIDDFYENSKVIIPASINNGMSLYSPGDVTSVITDPTFRGGTFTERSTFAKSFVEDRSSLPSKNTESFQMNNESTSLLSHTSDSKSNFVRSRGCPLNEDPQSNCHHEEPKNWEFASIVGSDSLDDVSALMSAKGVEDLWSMDQTVETPNLSTPNNQDFDIEEGRSKTNIEMNTIEEGSASLIRNDVDKEELNSLTESLPVTALPCGSVHANGAEYLKTNFTLNKSSVLSQESEDESLGGCYPNGDYNDKERERDSSTEINTTTDRKTSLGSIDMEKEESNALTELLTSVKSPYKGLCMTSMGSQTSDIANESSMLLEGSEDDSLTRSHLIGEAQIGFTPGNEDYDKNDGEEIDSTTKVNTALDRNVSLLKCDVEKEVSSLITDSLTLVVTEYDTECVDDAEGSQSNSVANYSSMSPRDNEAQSSNTPDNEDNDDNDRIDSTTENNSATEGSATLVKYDVEKEDSSVIEYLATAPPPCDKKCVDNDNDDSQTSGIINESSISPQGREAQASENLSSICFESSPNIQKRHHETLELDTVETSNGIDEGALSAVRLPDMNVITANSNLCPSFNNPMILHEGVRSDVSSRTDILLKKPDSNNHHKPQEPHSQSVRENPFDSLIENNQPLSHSDAPSTIKKTTNSSSQMSASNSIDRIIENGATLSWLGAIYGESASLIDIQSNKTAEEKNNSFCGES